MGGCEWGCDCVGEVVGVSVVLYGGCGVSVLICGGYMCVEGGG